MTAVLQGFDKPIKNYIDELSKTGHVTHKSYTKTSVTFHHNAGRLSHDGVMNVWRYRPASAQFNVDRAGTYAQFVKTLEYAWATGNTEGNQRSISIEMANAELSPSWEVSETTWKAAARLAGFLFAKVIKRRPSRSNVHYHSYWYATACAGPWMDRVYDDLLAEVKKWYSYYLSGSGSTLYIPGSPKIELLDVDGAFGRKTVYATSWAMAELGYRVSADGEPTDQINRYYTRAVQTALNEAGHRDKYGRKLVVDGVGLGYNIGKRYPKIGWMRTITAIQGGYGLTPQQSDGFFSPDDSWTVRKIQSDVNNGARDVPFFIR